VDRRGDLPERGHRAPVAQILQSRHQLQVTEAAARAAVDGVEALLERQLGVRGLVDGEEVGGLRLRKEPVDERAEGAAKLLHRQRREILLR